VSSGWLRRPAREQPLALAGLALAFVVAIAAAVILTHGHPLPRQRVKTVTAPPAPSAVIGTQPSQPALTAAQLAQARRTARRFLANYLPVLYGRAPTRTITGASARVRAELSAAGWSPRAPRNRLPRVTQLATHVQSSATVVAIAIVADGITRPYQVVFQLSHGPGGWQVTELANY
jgi:hypothetical protein